MKAKQELISTKPDESFKAFRHQTRAFTFEWHQHPEFELTLITRGHGTRFIGDHVSRYAAPDAVLIGPGVPHTWQTDDDATSNHALVLQFKETAWGPDFFESAEMRSLEPLFIMAGRGVHLSRACADALAPLMRKVIPARGIERIRQFLACLDIIAGDVKASPLASARFDLSSRLQQPARINRVCDYVLRNLSSPVSLDRAAKAVHMTPSSLSRFFRRETGRTFMSYVNDLRIGEACRLLMESEHSIAEICYASGFNNLSNFNRRFRETHGMTPSEFRASYQPITGVTSVSRRGHQTTAPG